MKAKSKSKFLSLTACRPAGAKIYVAVDKVVDVIAANGVTNIDVGQPRNILVLESVDTVMKKLDAVIA